MTQDRKDGGAGTRRLHLEDHGQDFLHFDIDADGKIVATGPFQGWMWNGRIVAPESIKRGMAPRLSGANDGGWMMLRYPIRRIERLSARKTEPQS